MLNARLQWWLESNQLLSPSQYRFRPGLSTQDVMSRLQHDTLSTSSPHLRIVAGVDVRKAFDSVPHSSVLSMAQQLGITGRAYNFIAAFLEDRTFAVHVGTSHGITHTNRAILRYLEDPQAPPLGSRLLKQYETIIAAARRLSAPAKSPTSPFRSSDLELRSGRFTSATMPDENANTTDQRPLQIKNRQRDSSEFAGTPDSDVQDWLKNYDRVSQHNRWDDMIKLANVVFFLKDTALQRFDNHETEINSWDGFKAAFADVFDTPERRRQHAKDKLSKRYQAASESPTSYIEDVLRLCSRVNAAMPEDEKIRHLFKGLSQQLFSVVAPKSPPTVHQLIAECKKYEELQSVTSAVCGVVFKLQLKGSPTCLCPSNYIDIVPLY
ncbi:uncharacterized protein ISCGN_009338 [Ixodes scapularis]